MNVLVVSGGSFQGLAVLRNLQRAPGVRLIVADCFEENIGREFAHHFWRVPMVVDELEFLKSIDQICRLEQIHVIIPATQIELEALAANRARFEALGAFVAVSQLDMLRLLNDKQRTSDYASRHGFPVVPLLQWDAVPSNLPVVAKPRFGWGGRELTVIHEPDQFAAISDPDRYVFQRYLPDPREYSCDFAIGPNFRVSKIHVRRRARTLGGFAVISEFTSDPTLHSLAARFAARLGDDGALGLFNVQFLSCDDGTFISDVNPRIGTSAVGFPDAENPVVGLCRWCEKSERPAITVSETMGCPARHPTEPTALQNATVDFADSAGPHSRSSARRIVRFLDELVLPRERKTGLGGVVFDLDDTLIDHRQWIRAKLEGMHGRLHAALPAKSEFVLAGMQFVDEGQRAKLIDLLIERFSLNRELRERMIDSYRREVPVGEFVHIDVMAVLDELRRRGLRTGILTDNPPESQKQKLAVTRLNDAVDGVVFSRESGAEKPATTGFSAMSDLLNVSAAKLIMVGDNLYRDAIGALQAGYAGAFLVQRRGAMLNCDVSSVAGLFEGHERIVPVDGVFALLRYL